jgi:CheY-like chemotaxis protein
LTFEAGGIRIYLMKKVLYIDDDKGALKRVADHVAANFPGIELTPCDNAVDALTLIDKNFDLIIMDFEMPTLDGKKLLTYAIARGVDRKKIVIISGRDSDYLHGIFKMGECLCVINKHDKAQLAVLDMVLGSVEKKL